MLFRPFCQDVSVFGQMTQTWREGSARNLYKHTFMARGWSELMSGLRDEKFMGASSLNGRYFLLAPGSPLTADVFLGGYLSDYAASASGAIGWPVHSLSPPFPSHFPAQGGLVIQFWPVRCKKKSGSLASGKVFAFQT